jgi:hypothetical protein
MDTSLAHTLSEKEWGAMPNYLQIFLQRLCERELQQRQEVMELTLQMEAVVPLLQGQSAESVFTTVATVRVYVCVL